MIRRIRLCILHNLIFFAGFFLASCGDDKAEIKIRWVGNKAAGMSIPLSLISSDDDLNNNLKIRILKSDNSTDILGNLNKEGDSVIFQPLVPFSRGLSYVVLFGGKTIGSVTIPEANAENAPEVLAIYPTGDTLPENLLKVYIHFSRPMRSGESQQQITLIADEKDILKEAFLDLQPELWNEDQTVLTLWLDPGRVKRDLIPNRTKGQPLNPKHRYRLEVSETWRDTDGLPLRKQFIKSFSTVSRDSRSPDPATWQLQLPAAGTKAPLVISFKEPLDYYLLKETISIWQNGKAVPGSQTIGIGETDLQFIPEKAWQRGTYSLRVNTILEDLAGNNVNRLFDRDLMNSEEPKNSAFSNRMFSVK